MNSIADRLRGIVRPAGGPKRATGPRARPVHGRRSRGDHMDPAAILDGEWTQAGSHRFLVVDRSYAPGHRHGSVSIADSLPPEEGWSRLGLLAGTSCGGTCSSSTSRRLASPAVPAAMRFWSDAAGSIAAAFTCGSSCFRASRQSVLCSKRSEMLPARRCGRDLQRQVVRSSAHRDSLRAEPVDDAVCGHAARGHASPCEAALAWRR